MSSKLSKNGIYPFKAEQNECNFRKQLFSSTLIQQMLTSADYHSTERKFGTAQLQEVGKTWVLSRFAIEIVNLPQRHAQFNIETFIESVATMFTNRCFIAAYKDGEVFASGKSVWAMLDVESRKPQNILDFENGALNQYIFDEKKVSIEKPSRVKVDDNLVLFRTIETYYNDIDFNGHVNSCRYIEHVLDLFSMDWHSKYIVKRLDVVFVSEAHCGDTLNFYCSAPQYIGNVNTKDERSKKELSAAELSPKEVEYVVKICKISKDDAQEKECVRVKVLWRTL